MKKRNNSVKKNIVKYLICSLACVCMVLYNPISVGSSEPRVREIISMQCMAAPQQTYSMEQVEKEVLEELEIVTAKGNSIPRKMYYGEENELNE